MPTYEYRCTQCAHEMEAFQSMKDEALSTCPACGTESLKRQISRGTGMIFKGSGFYETDYRRKSGGKSEEGSASSAPAATESKPAGCAGGCACHGAK